MNAQRPSRWLGLEALRVPWFADTEGRTQKSPHHPGLRPLGAGSLIPDWATEVTVLFGVLPSQGQLWGARFPARERSSHGGVPMIKFC